MCEGIEEYRIVRERQQDEERDDLDNIDKSIVASRHSC